MPSDHGSIRTADHYYRVVVVRERVRLPVRILRICWTELAQLIAGWWSFGTIPYENEPKLRTKVELVRIHDSSVAVAYEYKTESEALAHYASLDGRLRSMSVPDIDRDLGIGWAAN